MSKANTVFLLTLCGLALLLASPLALSAPEGGVVRAGQASIHSEGSLTRIQQVSERAVIDWRGFGTAAHESVLFQQPASSSATLNRVTGDQASLLLGRLDANGHVFLINPHGILIGPGARVNVAGLVASSANISDQNFMAGHLQFDQPGRPGASIINQGQISAAEGGLVALVAPQVRNDGIIQALLGKVVLGAGDTFTLDLYGDQLINLAMRDGQVGQLLDDSGKPLTPSIQHGGTIEADGGQVVMVSAATGKQVLDEVINVSGLVRAQTVRRQGGKIQLLGRGGRVKVSGKLNTAGREQGQRGGTIEVLGDQVQLTSSAQLDASGQAGGGRIRVGGAWQGQGETYRAKATEVAQGATLSASAIDQGDGGEVVVWSDGATRFEGSIAARGGENGGDGGRVEVSGKQRLDFLGTVDAGAPLGAGGSLLLDPAYLNIGLAEAGLINRVLRTGTSTSLQADLDISVNAMIDGRGRYAGGGLSMWAGRDIHLNDHVVTYNGAINLSAGGSIFQQPAGLDQYGAPMTVQLRSGSAPISLNAGGDLSPGSLVTTGGISVVSGSNLTIGVPIYETVGNANLQAAGNIFINQVVANATSGGHLNMSAGGQIEVNAKVGPWDRASGGTIDRNALPGGRIALAAAGDINIHTDIASYKGMLTGLDDASIGLTSTGGAIHLDQGIKVMSDGGAIRVSSLGDLQNGFAPANINDPVSMGYLTTGPLSLTSTQGNVSINQTIPDTTGAVSITAGNGIQVNQRIYTAHGDISLRAGAGGITMAPTIDGGTYYVSDLDAGLGDLWLEADGDIHLAGIRSSGYVTVRSNAGIINGGGLLNIIDSRRGAGTPVRLDLSGYGGIRSVYTGLSNNIHALASNGSVDAMTVFYPGILEVIAGEDIKMSGMLGEEVGLFAGRDIVSVDGWSLVGNINAKAGRDLSLGDRVQTTIDYLGNPGSDTFSVVARSVSLSAGSNPFSGLTSTIVGLAPPDWTSQGAGAISATGTAWLWGEGGLTASASGDIMLAPVHVSYNLNTVENTTSILQTQQPFTLQAGGDIGLQRIETMGPVSLTSSGGNITVASTLGPHVSVLDPSANLWNPYDKGVASVNILAQGPGAEINIREIRAEGAITVAATHQSVPGRIFLHNEFSSGAPVGMQTTTGSVSLYDRYDPAWNDPLVSGSHYYHYLSPDQAAVIYPDHPDWYDYVPTISSNQKPRLVATADHLPVIAVGPTIAGPGGPLVPGALPPGAPGASDNLAEVFVDPSNQVDSETEDNPAVIDEEQLKAATQLLKGTASRSPGINPLAFDTATGSFLVFPGGRGVTLEDEERRR